MTRLLLRNARLLTPDGENFTDPADVLLTDGRVTSIAPAAGPPLPAPPPGARRLATLPTGAEVTLTDAETLDAHGAQVVPGLIDAHYHLISRSAVEMDARAVALSLLEGVRNAADCIASGVTAVRDCGCRHAGIYPLREAIAAGTVVGPDPWVAGRNPTGERAPAHWRNIVGRGPEGIRRAVREQYEAGADWVKLILAHAENPTDWSDVVEFVSSEEIAAAVDEAHALGIAIGGHCEGWDVASRAVRLGLDSLDHAPLISAEVAAAMAARDMVYVPTVWAFSDDSGLDDSTMSADELRELARWQAEHQASVRRARDAGVRIAAGSDSADVVTGRGVLAKEILALERCGLSRSEALRAATATAAHLIGRPDLGRATEGATAHLVVLTGNPLEDLAVLERPAAVIKDGRLVFDREHGVRPPHPPAGRPLSTTARWSS